MDLPPLYFHASLEEKWDEEEEPGEIETVLKVVPPAYHQYLDLFSKVKGEKIPAHHACDHHIELEGFLPPVGVIFSLSNQELEKLWAYISENVEKFFIRPSFSSTGAPVLFLKKKDGGLCLGVDYHKLNAVTRKGRYPVPPMNQLLTILNRYTIFSKIDLPGGYNLLRIKEGDENLTAFRTKYGKHEYLVMLFGLTNAPASFQNIVNDIFAYFLDIFVVVYLDDIIVFFSSEEEHVKHVASVLQRLRYNNLFSKASKCVFPASSVEYLGYVFSRDGLKMDYSKVQKILNWPQPNNIKALQSFLGFANFYCCFMKNYSKRITALTSLLKKDTPFIFNEEALSHFQILKEAFTTAPILSLQTIVEPDSSDYALGDLLSQVNDSGKNPIEFDSCQPLPAELNYEIHDKELLGIVCALKCWRVFLLSLSNFFMVLKNHSSLQYFISSKVLPYYNACWAEFVSDFHFTITYCTGRLATLPDALSCQDNMYPERGVDFISKTPQNYHQVIKQDGIRDSRFFSIKVEISSDLVDQIQKEVWQDKDYKEILKQLARGEVVIPRNEEIQPNIIKKCHDSPLVRHPGQEKTLKLIKRDFYWAGMNQSLRTMCPHYWWKGSPKMEIFIPAYGKITSLNLAQIFIKHVFSKHGLPASNVSNRGSLFVSSFWTQSCQQLKIPRDLSTTSHPETDGQI
ncbi:hypothetical protein O181_018465 [Austropuccinia psidii MF-1]|uniref:Reverse transcriptase domain-containing protein n=1 Tax=Austropuccinia psidii MF-1 TaxID=1389203 RepID=A0A9Q3GU29_9BASI|nr:hypothetical protein [Austropuccinia psidii MF-1]